MTRAHAARCPRRLFAPELTRPWCASQSKEDHFAHQVGFMTYAVMAILHKILQLTIHCRLANLCPAVTEYRKSFQWRLGLCILHIACFVIAMVFYYLHNATCGDYLFSAFGFFEYILVYSNIGFQAVAVYDFHDYVGYIGPRQGDEGAVTSADKHE